MSDTPRPSSIQSSIHLKGDLSDPPSRGLWLVKWLLIIPHLFPLLFLTIAVFFVGIIAFFAVLFTGTYPRKMFDFVVGVARWWWRIEFYSYGVLGTDLYPPFSLKSKEDYPADLHIDYPDALNNWLPLVKWFLAIPHYLILVAFFGTSIELPASYASEFAYGKAGHFRKFSDWYMMEGNHIEDFSIAFPGLIGILLIIVAIILLFTGKYQKDIYRFIMGIQRWGYRVYAYVFLLTDEYPHFRLMEE